LFALQGTATTSTVFLNHLEAFPPPLAFGTFYSSIDSLVLLAVPNLPKIEEAYLKEVLGTPILTAVPN